MNIVELFSLQGKTAIVTGSTQGIGFGVAEALASAGANVVINGREKEKTKKAAEELEKKLKELNLKVTPKVLAVEADMTNVEQINHLVAKTIETFGRVDILINNAGTIIRGKLVDYSFNDWKKTMDLNLNSAFHMTQLCGRDMLKRGWGRVIMMGSIHSYVSIGERTSYAATKGALLQFCKSLALEWADKGITVNTICPGFIETPITEPLRNNPELNKDITSRVPMRRWGKPHDLAGLTILLASDAGSYITGAGILVDGGYTAQ